MVSPSSQRHQVLMAASGLVSVVFLLSVRAVSAFQAPPRLRFLNTRQIAFSTHQPRRNGYQRPFFRPSEKRRNAFFQSERSREAEPHRLRFVSKDALGAHRFALQRKTSSTGQSLMSRATEIFAEALKKCWWCLPMVIALIPLFSALFQRTSASMPSWWALVELDHVLHSPGAVIILGVFLLSNISYFISGIYLYRRYYHLVPNEIETIQERDPLLGGSVLTAGAVSTIFHSVQALGPFSVAEALCYIDHGVAISSILYFYYKCGLPSRTTWVLSIAGFVSLCVTNPGYAWLHSLWHVLSAAAAVVWARDGLEAPHAK